MSNHNELVTKLRKMNTEDADHAVYLLSVADDVFCEIHAIIHARSVLDGGKCAACTEPLKDIFGKEI